jgi:hypothetical protein
MHDDPPYRRFLSRFFRGSASFGCPSLWYNWTSVQLDIAISALGLTVPPSLLALADKVIDQQCPLLALSGHAELHCTCRLSGVKRTSRDHLVGGAASLWSYYARQQEGFQRLNSHLLLCLKSGTPTCMKRTSSSLSESCPKIGDLPKSPFPPVAALVPSAGIITLQISLVRRGCHQHLCLYIRTLLAARVSH